jgi:hypothetical protein
VKPSTEFGRALVKLEEATSWEGGAHDVTCTPDQRIALSTAISLKRIADALDGTNGLPICQAIEQAIGTGMFHGFQNLKR